MCSLHSPPDVADRLAAVRDVSVDFRQIPPAQRRNFYAERDSARVRPAKNRPFIGPVLCRDLSHVDQHSARRHWARTRRGILLDYRSVRVGHFPKLHKEASLAGENHSRLTCGVVSVLPRSNLPSCRDFVGLAGLRIPVNAVVIQPSVETFHRHTSMAGSVIPHDVLHGLGVAALRAIARYWASCDSCGMAI